MKKARFTDSQIIAILKRAETGTPVHWLCSEHGMSSASVYKWRSQFVGMDASVMTRLKELEDENRRLKKSMPKNVLNLRLFRKPCKKLVTTSQPRELAQSAIAVRGINFR